MLYSASSIVRRACAGAAVALLCLLISTCDTSEPAATNPVIEDVLNRVREYEFTVGIVGDAGDAYFSEELPGQRQSTTLDNFVSADVSAVWFSPDTTHEALTSDYLPELKQAMGDGKSLVFIGLEDPNRLRTLFGLPLEHSIGPDPDVPDVVYAWEMPDPQTDDPLIAIGLIFQPETASELDTVRQVLVQSYQHSGNINRNFQEWPGVASSNGADWDDSFQDANEFASIGQHWQLTFGPAEYNWGVPDCGGCTLNEYKSGWSFGPDERSDYFAMRLDQAVTGTPGGAVEHLTVKSDADAHLEPGEPHQDLYRYGPENPIDTGTTHRYDISFAFGGTADWFQASWNSPIEDAVYLNRSNLSIEYFEGQWDYDAGSDYAQSASYQYPGFSYRLDKGADEAWMHNFRSAEWEHGSKARLEGEFLTQVPSSE